MAYHHTPSHNRGRGGPGNRRPSSLSSHHTSPSHTPNQTQKQNQNQNRDRSATVMGPPPPPSHQQPCQAGEHPFAGQFGQVTVLTSPAQGFIGVAPVYFHQNHPHHPLHHHQQPTYHSLQNQPFTHHQNQNQNSTQNRSPTHSHPSRDFSNHRPRQGSVHQYRRITPPTPTSLQTTHAHPTPASQIQQVPEVLDRYSLQTAVRMDPDTTFSRINSVREERDSLLSANKKLAEQLEMAKGDYGNVLKGMETLNGIWREKQVLFWKFVERVRREREGDLVRDENSGEGGGEWIGDREEEEGVSAEEVERLWGLKLRRDFPSSAAVVEVAGDGGEDGVDDADEEEESQRGRSSEVMLRSFPVARVTVEGQEEESEVVSLEERSILSAGEPLSSDASLLLAAQANARLDPNARPFIPSPTRSTNRGNDSSRNTPNPHLLPKILPAIPLSFSDALKRQPVPANQTPSQTPPPSAETRKAAITQQHDERTTSTSTSTKANPQASTQGANTRGGKKGNKSSHHGGGAAGGGVKTPSMAERLFNPQYAISSLNTNTNPLSVSRPGHSGSSASGGNELAYAPLRKKNNNNKKGSRSPTKRPTSPIAVPRPISNTRRGDGKQTPGQVSSIEPIQRKVSPEIVRVANLPAYPHELAIAALKAANEAKAAAAAAKEKEAAVTKEQEVAKEKQALRNATSTFLSRAKMNATLQAIGSPFKTVCPFSLLQEGGCAVRGCNLLHVCELFNGVLGEETEFPPLASPLLGESAGMSKGRNGCMDTEGRLVQPGEVCSADKIHLLRSCPQEIEGEECPFWGSPSSSPLRKQDPTSVDEECSGEIYAHPLPIHMPTSATGLKEMVFTAESKEEHFKLFAHERDGAGREAWSARAQNAGLRSTHACGLWGVDIGFGVSGEEEDVLERREKIEWKGKEKSVGGGGYEDSPWRARSASRRGSVVEESPWRGSSRRGSSRGGSVVEERVGNVKGKGKGMGTPKSRDRFGEAEEDFTRGLKWEERKGMTKEDWKAKGEWKK